MLIEPGKTANPFSGPRSNQSDLDLRSVIDDQEIQSIMDDFHSLTGMVTAILDLDGNVLESTGWQKMCTQFHRVNAETAKKCIQSDLERAKDLKPGEIADYRCGNGLRDVVTPLYVGGQHVGNIYTGQFFYDDEPVDEEEFIRRAEAHGFDKTAYLESLRNIPRYSRDTISHLMGFLVKMTSYISRIGLANIELAREIRNRKRAQTAWQESETHLRTLVRTIPDLVWLKDEQGVYLFCNSRFEDFFGAKEAEIIGKTDYDFVNKELADFFRKHDQEAMAKGSPSKNEEDVVFASDGHSETLETIKTPMYTNTGQLAGVLGIGRDITERRQAETALRNSEMQLRKVQKMDSIGRLAGGVAHDLNNLLTPIIGYSEMLRGDFGTDEARRKSTEIILGAGFRARDLVRQLLAFSSKQTLEYRVVDLNKVVLGFEKLLRHTIRENIRIECELSPGIPMIMADIGQIEQVILNLAVNAADAMPDGGLLLIETSAATLDGASPGFEGEQAPGRYLRLAVSDTGRGLDAETSEHMFEPFYSTKGEQGTGLGLSAVYGIVKQHGGHIGVHCEPGQRTTLEIFLPADEATTDEATGNTVVGEAPTGSETILLVEDSEQVRRMASRILVQSGYRVLEAENGEAALAVLDSNQESVDLMLTDVVMPGIGGRELYDLAAERRPGLKVIFMSGYNENDMAWNEENAAKEKYLQKPFGVYSLASCVREVLDKPAVNGPVIAGD